MEFCTDNDTLNIVSSDTSLSVKLESYKKCYIVLETAQSICPKTGLTKSALRSKVKDLQDLKDYYKKCYMALETAQSICQQTGFTKLQLCSKVK